MLRSVADVELMYVLAWFYGMLGLYYFAWRYPEGDAPPLAAKGLFPIFGFENPYFVAETGIPLADDEPKICFSPRIEPVNLLCPIGFFSVAYRDLVLVRVVFF
jgi:hypothetical protein